MVGKMNKAPREIVITVENTNSKQLMITDQVIKEIYKKLTKPPKAKGELRLDYFKELLKNHNLQIDDDEVIITGLEEFNPFRRFLIRSLHGVLEFDKVVAFVFKNHILFLSKIDNNIRIHMKPEEEDNSFLARIFGKKH